MKSNLLQYYLNWNVKCYVLIILGISCLIVYVQQEYIIVPQIICWPLILKRRNGCFQSLVNTVLLLLS